MNRQLKIVITGSSGFIGSNLVLWLENTSDVEVCAIKDRTVETLSKSIVDADIVFHLSGVNRSSDESEFILGNVVYTETLAKLVKKEAVNKGKNITVVFTSSVQATNDTVYGQTKAKAEIALSRAAEAGLVTVFTYRLPNVFGKFARINHNSFVATCCYNLARGLPVKLDDPEKQISLLYIDDLINIFENLIESVRLGDTFGRASEIKTVAPFAVITVGELYHIIKTIAEMRENSLVANTCEGLERALYSTFISYLPIDKFSQRLSVQDDSRGYFTEILKTSNSGQFSCFSIRAGSTRGGHFHHTKTEKFIVVSGKAILRYRNLSTGEYAEFHLDASVPEIVDTVPGWAHEITSDWDQDVIVLLWANELFDNGSPDTFECSLAKLGSK